MKPSKETRDSGRAAKAEQVALERGQSGPGAAYTDPVRRLLFIGESDGWTPATWPDYPAAYGLGREHAAELIGLACDSAFDGEDGEEIWAPMHAWRALGQLKVEEATAPLLALLSRNAEDDDVLSEELPAVFGMIGPPAIPHLAGYLSGQSISQWAAIAALGGLKEIAARCPEQRGECIVIVARMLARHEDADPLINGFAIWNLIDLGAVEAIYAIREVFRRGVVDLSVVGDEEDVEIALGLRNKRTTPMQSYHTAPLDWLTGPEAAVPPWAGKIGRNDPCPCGSGKKYKKCCLR